MRVDDLDYRLPPEAVAQTPVAPRQAARLLVDQGPGCPPAHHRVADLADLLRPGDVVVVNDTRVLPARLQLRKPTGGQVEVLALGPLAETTAGAGAPAWEALVRPSRRVAPGTVLAGADGRPVLTVGTDRGEGRREVLFCDPDPLAALAAHGEVPLPPYITAPLDDPERYQTTYAARPASVAAPTAGLHLAPAVLDGLRDRGIPVVPVELVIGLDTFRPIQVDDLADHPMHTEAYRVPERTWAAVGEARRVVAVGTTSVRALESRAATGAATGRTDLFLRRGSRFAVVDVLLTNFHLPRTTLLALVDAFVGPRWRDLYQVALDRGYRFLSFGDAMLLTRDHPAGPA